MKSAQERRKKRKERKKEKSVAEHGTFLAGEIKRAKINDREKRRENLCLVSVLIKTGNTLDTSRKSVFDHECPSPC